MIVASSPTCEFGRILHHLTLSVERPNDMIALRRLDPAEHARPPACRTAQKRVRIYDRWYDVQCQVRTIHGLAPTPTATNCCGSSSRHSVPQTTAFVVHGEVPQAETFANRLIAAGIGRAEVPAMESSFVAFSAMPEKAPEVSTTAIRAED